MSYISAKRLKGNVVVWERDENQQRVVKEFKTPWYYYTEAKQGEYKSLYGKNLIRHDFNTKAAFKNALATAQYNKSYGQMIYESDIQPETKILAEHYHGKPAPKLHITFLDIEVDYDERRGFSSTDNPYAPINSISLHHTHTDETIVFAVPPEGWEGVIEPEVQALADIYLCKNEKELLQYFYAEIEDSDCLTGWNCIPVGQHIWGNELIIPISEASGRLYDSNIVRTFPITKKEKYVITLANGATIESSKDHRFPIKSVPHEKYTNLTNKIVTHSVSTAGDIQTSTEVVFMETTLRSNESDDNDTFTNEQLYLLGLIYTDGTLKKKGNPKQGFTIYQSDYVFLINLPLATTSVVGPYKNNYSRGVKYSILGDDCYNIIYDVNCNKRLNVPVISSLSYTQFMHFLAGLLDGDGYIANVDRVFNKIEWCNFNDDIKPLYDLCAWNGIFCTQRENVLRIIDIDIGDIPLRKTSRWDKLNYNKPNRKNTSAKANLIKYRHVDGKIYIRVTGVTNTGDIVDMMDIETDTHYFYVNGVKTHNSDFFDLPYIYRRTEMVLGPKWSRMLSFNVPDKYQPDAPTEKWDKPYDCMEPRQREVNTGFNVSWTVDFIGRIKMDYLWLFKKYEMGGRPSYKLESIADAEVPHLPKLKYVGNLHHLYRDDFSYFIRYNIRDTEILKELEKKLGYVALASEMYHLSCGDSKDVTGTIQLADKAAVNYCHETLDVRVPDRQDIQDGGDIKGAVVLEPNKGLHKYVASIDINSLYPSAIRSVNISPEKIIGQFAGTIEDWNLVWSEDDEIIIYLELENGEHIKKTGKEWKAELLKNKWSMSGYGTVFDQGSGKGFIPAILEEWYATRKVFQAKKSKALDAGDKELAAYFDRLQYVYKIKLNSFYGALTNQFFRFYDLRMGESTTGTGRGILMHQCAKVSELLDGTYDPHGESVLYGDTDSTYFSTGCDNDEDAVRVGDDISNTVSDSFPEFMESRFCCTADFKDLIKAGREVIADAAIFVEKKRYIMHVFDNEGEKCDKVKAMGLDLKKTTTPKVIQDMLIKTVRMIMAEEDDGMINDYIIDCRDTIELDMNFFDIGLPKGVNKVKEYTEAYRLDNTTRLPGHVAAALHYNLCLKEYGDRESIELTSGMKLKVFYIKNNRYGRFKSIALPTDMTEIPEWFNMIYKDEIDKTAHSSRLLDNNLKNIFKAIDRVVPTKDTRDAHDAWEW